MSEFSEFERLHERLDRIERLLFERTCARDQIAMVGVQPEDVLATGIDPVEYLKQQERAHAPIDD